MNDFILIRNSDKAQHGQLLELVQRLLLLLFRNIRGLSNDLVAALGLHQRLCNTRVVDASLDDVLGII